MNAPRNCGAFDLSEPRFAWILRISRISYKILFMNRLNFRSLLFALRVSAVKITPLTIYYHYM